MFNRKHQLCKTCSETIKKWAHRNGVTMSRAVAIRLSEGKPKMGRPQDNDATATRKALTSQHSTPKRLQGVHTASTKAEPYGYVVASGSLAHVARDSRMGYLGNNHKANTATRLHRTKRAKKEGRPPEGAKLGGGYKHTDRIVPRTYSVVEPLVVAQASPQARYEGTKRLHALGWLPPMVERPEKASDDSTELNDGEGYLTDSGTSALSFE